MKAFEKEWKKTLLSDKYKPIAKAYYRAALEWVKNHPDLGNQFHMTEAINKELEEN